MHKNRQVYLLVAPVDLQQWLEPSQEPLNLIEGAFDNVSDHVLLLKVDLILVDP